MQIIGSVNLLENAPEVISEGLNFKIFPGEHAPRPPSMRYAKHTSLYIAPPLIIFLNEPLASK